MVHDLGFDDEGKPVLITRAAYSYDEQHRRRVRKYLKLMIWRIPAFLGAAIAYLILRTQLPARQWLDWIATVPPTVKLAAQTFSKDVKQLSCCAG